MDKAKLDEQIVLLTGAAGAIGSAIAEALYHSGARLMLADIDTKTVKSVASNLDQERERVCGRRYDAASREDATALVESCVEKFGRIDHIVSAAAIFQRKPFLEMTDEDWRRTMSINTDGVFYLCRRAVPHMVKGGTIVVVASSAAHEGTSPEHVHYGASKAAILGFTKSLAREIAPNIRVNAVSPGTINTAMVKDLLENKREQFLGGIPAGRLGTADEVADAVKFLCSSASSFVTGSVIHVNGGAYMGG